MLNATRACELLVGLPAVKVLAVTGPAGQPLRVTVERLVERPACAVCATPARVKDRPAVELVDLASFGRPTRLVWRKHRWCCPSPDCAVGSWTGLDARIAAPRLAMTDRAGRWVCEQVGRRGRTVNEIAVELGCDWHTINDTVIAYGTALVEDPARIGAVDAQGEVRMAWHAKEVVREIYTHTDPALGLEFVTRLGVDLQDESCPPEVRQLGRTITKWRAQIAAWHQAHVSNGPTEAANNLIKRVKRVAFGFTSFRNYRIRTLLYAGKPNWGLLATITPR